MSTTTGYPSSLTVVTPHGPCTLTLRCFYPQERADDEVHTPTGTDPEVRVELTCPQLKVGEVKYSANVHTYIDPIELSYADLALHIHRPPAAAHLGPVPDEHVELWRHLATSVLRQLLTLDNFELLRRADTHRALQAAKREVDVLNTSLSRAHKTVRYYEVLTAVLDLEDPTQRAIGLRLAGTWLGTADELLTIVHALSEPEDDQPET